MNIGLITSIIESILRKLPPDILKLELDHLLDRLEDVVVKSNNKIDDAIVLNLTKALRGQLSIEELPGSPYEDKPITITTTGDVNVTGSNQ